MGGDMQPSDAREIGTAVAQLEQILLTGAPIGDGRSQRVHRAAMHAAWLTGRARLIGILPRRGQADPEPGAPAPGAVDPEERGDRYFETIRGTKGFYFHTGMENEERDSITGLTPDVLIFLRGSAGTLCELAFAAAAGRRTYFVNCAAFLREKLQAAPSAATINLTFAKALRHCHLVNGRTLSVNELKDRVVERLATAEDWRGSLREMVAEAVKTAAAEGLGRETGFPAGIGQDEKREFERRVLEMEQP